ncbi:MAG: folylpolyglutamate synthase/dihydrofolate synthase family protein [Anaerovoracaceae bacterium]
MGEKTAKEKIHEFDRFGSVLGLERMLVLLEKLGNPQNGLSVIHVAGTNGKGSVSRFIYEGLQANDYKVGLFSSPFITCFNERIQFDGHMISDHELDQYTKRVLEKVDLMIKEGKDSPTEFEVVTAIALLYFAEMKSDFVILEVGLGGRGDSTNVVEKPLISIITSISYDHMDKLGNTLGEIAGEKAGIIKENVPVVSGVESEEARKVIAKVAYEKGARLYDATKIPYKITRADMNGAVVDMEINETGYGDVAISMGGEHQVKNLRTALTAIEIMRKKGQVKVERAKLYQGIKNSVLPGRFEVMGGNPYYILDGAHNQAGAKALKDAMKTYFPQAKILLVVGMLADKQVDEILAELVEITDQVIVTEPDNPRKLPMKSLEEKFNKLGANTTIASGAKAACAAARNYQKSRDVILFSGSLYLIGQIREMLKDEKESNIIL